MSDQTTEKQRLANTQNAQSSTGPRTTEGKARAARNALKHGLTAKVNFLPFPDSRRARAEFDRHLADFLTQLNPTDALQRTLVERIATIAWRLRNTRHFELGTLLRARETPGPEQQTIDDLRNRIAALEVAAAESQRLVQILNEEDTPMSDEEHEEYTNLLVRLAGRHPTILFHASAQDTGHDVYRTVTAVYQKQQTQLASLRADLRVAQQRDAQFRRRQALDALLPDADAHRKVFRLEAALDRQLQRALAALRRLQSVPLRGTTPQSDQNEPNCCTCTKPPSRRPAHGNRRSRP